MARFLIRSFTDSMGYTALERHDGTLPRTPQESYVPWAVTPGGDVVYAKTGEHTWRGGGGGKTGPSLRPYDTLMSQNRRKLAESELGLFALNHPNLTEDAVNRVTAGIQSYHDRFYLTQRDLLTTTIATQIGAYFYTSGRFGFGRISEAPPGTPEQVRRGIMHALVNGALAQKMSIHDAFGRKILVALRGPQLTAFDHWGPILRQDWFDVIAKRGRVNVPGSRPTTTGGIVPPSLGGSVGTTTQSRNRGADMFARDQNRTREPAADQYYDDLDARNLLFGAGISGTTGTLLQSAFAFAEVLRGEALKQYVLAIVGYLVGGGMHSFHESMAVAHKAGLPYTPGLYLPSLPESFINSHQGRGWALKYYDIVTLGATHWRHNATSLPSHLNPNLRN